MLDPHPTLPTAHQGLLPLVMDPLLDGKGLASSNAVPPAQGATYVGQHPYKFSKIEDQKLPYG